MSAADVDDAGDAGDVAQEMLRMQKRSWGGIEHPNVFTQLCAAQPAEERI